MQDFNTIDEIWLPVNGYEGTYQVSNLGRVQSLDRVVERKSGQGDKVRLKGRVLKCQKNTLGYYQVGIHIAGKRQNNATVHRLVAVAFIPNHEDKPMLNHKNGIKTDNNVANLEWATSSENNQHARSSGLNPAPKGTDTYNAKLTPALIYRARTLRELGYGYKAIGSLFGVTSHCIYDALNGRSWKHLNES